MGKNLASVGAIVAIVATVLSGFVFMDGKHAQAEDLQEFEEEVTQSLEESRLDIQYIRLDDAEFDLEEDPQNLRKIKRVEQVEQSIDRLLAKIERSND